MPDPAANLPPRIFPRGEGLLELPAAALGASSPALPDGALPVAWVIRTPRGLIIAESVARNGWRVSWDGARCLVRVPDYAPPGQGYRLCWEDGRGIPRAVAFDVAASPEP